MGVMKFRLPANEPGLQFADFRKAYITGLDRTPSRLGIELRNGMMTCVRDTMESGRLFVPWPIPGYGTPIVGTATLAERSAPYTLAVELARGKLNDVRNQLADWTLMGLRPTAELDEALGTAQHAFIRAVTFTDQPDVSLESAQACLQAASRRRSLDGRLFKPDPSEPAAGFHSAADPPRVHDGYPAAEAAHGGQLARDAQYVPHRSDLEADCSRGGPVRLGRFRCPTGVGKGPGNGHRGRAAR